MNRFTFSLLLVLLGSAMAAYVQTDAGSVTVKDIRFTGESGNRLSALLYLPDTVTPASPAPGILAVHGYINSRETQSGFAIELAKRGFVVLALDQMGHGYSDPPAFAAGFGGPDGLAYLRSLDAVDPERIGLTGHSMGGWTVQVAAASAPDDYQSMVLLGSSTGTFGAPEGTPTSPRNLLLVFSLFDEFSNLMWGAAIPRDIVWTPKLMKLFDTEAAVEPGRLYGDLDSGTARVLLMPPVTHPGDHLSREAIAATVNWFERTLGAPVPPSGQTWFFKELATGAALVGLACLLFPLIDWLLGLAMFCSVIREVPRPRPVTSLRWWSGATLAALVPVFLFFPLQTLANLVLPPNPLLPQTITNGVLLWAWGLGLVNLALFGLWLRGSGMDRTQLGLPANTGVIVRTMCLALIVMLVTYVILVACAWLFTVDFRFWVVALKPMSFMQFGAFVVYLPLFALFFLVLSLMLHNPLRRVGSSGWTNAGILSLGFVALLALQYLPLLSGGTMTIASQPLLTIVAFQFVPLLVLVAMVSTFCFERTGAIYLGAWINALVVTWYMVAGTATQAVPFWF
ncbi:MAG: alpha/beta hydrolase family protein [Pseudomonadota bacterium]